MILIITAVIIGLAIPTFLIGTGNVPEIFNTLPKTTGILSIILYVLLWIIAVTYTAWKFIGWKEVNSSNN